MVNGVVQEGQEGIVSPRGCLMSPSRSFPRRYKDRQAGGELIGLTCSAMVPARLVAPAKAGWWFLAAAALLGAWALALGRRLSLEQELLHLRRSSRRSSLLEEGMSGGLWFPTLFTEPRQRQPRVAHLIQYDQDAVKTPTTRQSSLNVPTTRHIALSDQEEGDESEENDDDPTRRYSRPDFSSRDDPAATMERRHWPVHELYPERCVPMSPWQSMSFPVCNLVHEHSFREGLVASATNETGNGDGLEKVNAGHGQGRLELLSSKGFWRHAWKHEEADKAMTTTVWRTFKMEHAMEEAFFENARVDALAMERLTFSPHVVSPYGFCGMTVVTEHAPHELSEVLAAVAARGGGLNATERLAVALQVARGVADVHHGLERDGRTSLIHNDMNLANLRVTGDGRPVLNDFNIAQLVMHDRHTGRPCPFASRFPNPQWRSPEEQVYSQEETDHRPPVVTEKIDVYALGNILYRLAVGSSPWKKPDGSKMTAEEKLEVARKKREKGQTPAIPSSISDEAKNDPALRLLLEAVDRCFQFRPEDRPTARQVVQLLSKDSIA